MRNIKVGKYLSCGCCGESFRTWEGYQDQDQDDGFGICERCQGIIAEHDKAEMNKAIKAISDSLNEENLKKFNELDRELQEGFVFALLEEGTLQYKITPAG